MQQTLEPGYRQMLTAQSNTMLLRLLNGAELAIARNQEPQLQRTKIVLISDELSQPWRDELQRDQVYTKKGTHAPKNNPRT